MKTIKVELTIKQAETILDALKRSTYSAANGNGSINYNLCNKAFNKVNDAVKLTKKT